MQTTLATITSSNGLPASFTTSTANHHQTMSLVSCLDYPPKPQDQAVEGSKASTNSTSQSRRRKSSRPSEPIPERLRRGRKSKSDAIIALSSNSPSSPRQNSRPSNNNNNSEEKNQQKNSSGNNQNRNQHQEKQQSKKEKFKAHPSRHPSRMSNSRRTKQGSGNAKKSNGSEEGKLDFDTIRTDAPRSVPKSRQNDRLFELEHAPVFYPTPDEFKDPMKYFEQIGPKLKSHGIGKVVPPLGWRPPFVLDTEQFKFKTRLQRLNSMEASARANANFMEQLYLFHKQQSNNTNVVTNSSKLVVPVIDYRPVDLWKLRKQINEMGGYDNITSQRKWSSLAKAMGYNVKASPAISFKLKAAYIKIIAPFDEYVNRVKQSPNGRMLKKEEKADRPSADSLSPITSSAADHDEVEQIHPSHESSGLVEGSGKSSILTRTNGLRASTLSNSSAQVDQSTNAKNDDASDHGDVCEVCRSDEDDSNILLCDFCDKGFHLQCLTPPLESVPDGNWYCDSCIVSTGNEFGFEEGREHTLSSFQRRADGFKKMWLETHPIEERSEQGDEKKSLEPVRNEGTAPVEVKEEEKEEKMEKNDEEEKTEKCDKVEKTEKGDQIDKTVEDDKEEKMEEGEKEKKVDEGGKEEKVDNADEAKKAEKNDKDKITEEDDPASSVWSTAALKNELILEDHIEREFWRLVESQSEAVEVEYGADIHSAVYGSGFPNLEKHPFEPYSRDSWNLNNLPIAPGSLLRFIKSDIAGMTQPWIYVGMVFSTFAWHKEDHYTYSINYHHWGDTKTWYGVPGEDDGKLEEAMKMAAPELFEQQPDLMFQLVTLMSPGRLKSAGVRTYVCDQRPNEFVITCPRSYHSGFNHGFNLNEAVNFCLPDWLSEGSLCVKHYKALSKIPVFSHDELLVTIFNNEKNPRVSRWLLPHFRQMVEREIADRKTASSQISNLSPDITIEPDDLPEEQVQCHHCKTFAFLSQVTSPDSSKVSCLDHSHTLGNGQKILRYKYSDDELQAMLQRVNSRSVKAGRMVDMSTVEQRTSSRKRKPSAALLEATKAALPVTQKMKLSHSSSNMHRDAHSDTSTQMDTSLTMPREGSFEQDEEDRIDHGSLVHTGEMAMRGKFRTKAEEMRMDVEEDQETEYSVSISAPRSRKNGPPSATPSVPTQEVNPRPLAPGSIGSVKLRSKASLQTHQSPPSRSTPSASLSKFVASSPDPASGRLDASGSMDKRRGRPPKTTETRAAEGTSSTAGRENENQPKSANSTPSKRQTVVAQIDVGGSASIVQLSPSAQRSMLELSRSSPSRNVQTPTGSRKRKPKSSAPPSNSPAVDPTLRIATPPSKPGPVSDRPGQNVIRIKSHNRTVSHPVEPRKISRTGAGDDHPQRPAIQPHHAKSLSQASIESPSSFGGKHTSDALPDYGNGRVRQGGLADGPPSAIPTPIEVLSHARSPTPSSLMSILNPVAVDPLTPFERPLSSKSTQSTEPPHTSGRTMYNHSPQLSRPSHHPPQQSSSHLPGYLERTPRSPKLANFGTGTPTSQHSHPHRHTQPPSSQFHHHHPIHPSDSPSQSHQSPPRPSHQTVSHYQSIQSPYQSRPTTRSSPPSRQNSRQEVSTPGGGGGGPYSHDESNQQSKREITSWTYPIADHHHPHHHSHPHHNPHQQQPQHHQQLHHHNNNQTGSFQAHHPNHHHHHHDHQLHHHQQTQQQHHQHQHQHHQQLQQQQQHNGNSTNVQSFWKNKERSGSNSPTGWWGGGVDQDESNGSST